jgi:hypothetical protein
MKKLAFATLSIIAFVCILLPVFSFGIAVSQSPPLTFEYEEKSLYYAFIAMQAIAFVPVVIITKWAEELKAKKI